MSLELYGGVWYTDYMVEDGRGNLEERLRDMKEYNIKIGTAFLLVAAYFGVMIFYTFLDVAVWRKVFPDFSNIINIITSVIKFRSFCLRYLMTEVILEKLKL